MIRVSVMRVVGMMPVDKAVIQPDPDTLGAEGFDIFFYQIPFAKRVGRFIIGKGTVKQAETVMVLCGHNGVLHAGPRAGMEYSPQWMNIPNLSRVNQSVFFTFSAIFGPPYAALNSVQFFFDIPFFG